MKEITGVFVNKDNLDRASNALEKLGIKKQNISLAAREKDIKNSLGKDYSCVTNLSDNSQIPRIRFISESSYLSRENIFITAMLYIGAVIALLVSILMHKSVGFDLIIAFSAGMVFQFLGILVSGFFRKRHVEYIERKLSKGGFLFWIKVNDDTDLIKEACQILKKHSAKKIRVINET